MSRGTLAAIALAAVALPWLLAGLVALARRPQRGVLVLVALAPLDGLLAIVPHPGVAEGWKEALVLVLLAATFTAPAAARAPPGRRGPDWLLPAAGLVLVGLASAVAVGGIQAVQGMKIGFFYLLLTWTLWRCPLNARDRDRLVSVLMVMGALTAAVGLAQQVVGPGPLLRLGYEYNTDIRFTGGLLRSFSTFNQPFPFGLFMMLVLLIGVPVALAAPRRPRNLAFFASCPLLLAGLVSSTVRAAMLGLVVGLLVLAVQRHHGLAHMVPAAAAALVLVPAASYAPLLSSESLLDRTSSWRSMADTVAEAPLGIGIGATGSAAERTAAVGGDISGTLVTARWSRGYQPDNYYVKTLLELGPFGLWLLILLLISTVLAARRAATSPGVDGALARGIGAATAAAAAASLVATYLEIFPMDLYFWLLLGVLARLPTRAPSGGLR